MASALMAWVWIGLMLAQLNKTGSHRYAHGHFPQDAQEKPDDGGVTAPEDWADSSFPAPVWHFLQGEDSLSTRVFCFKKQSAHTYAHGQKARLHKCLPITFT